MIFDESVSPMPLQILLDADRFHSDVSGEELQLRQERYHRSQRIYEEKRVSNAEKEDQRWQKIEETKAAEAAYWEEQRDLGTKVRLHAF
jgi:hypothetical protein